MSDASGLAAVEAARILGEQGPNEIRREARASPLRIFADQFRGALIWLLLVACVISAALGEVADAIAIAVIVVLNAIIGFVQELRAERSIAALRAMAAPQARVQRDGHVTTVAARDLVPGDLLVLDAGDVVGADGKLVEAHELTTNEAALTGESLPIEKRTTAVAPDAPLAEQFDRVFMGTSVASGNARATVTATGMNTELGRIAGLLASVKSEHTPLEKKLERVGRGLLVACLLIVALVAVMGLARGDAWLEVLVSSVSLAVAAVPEGLAAIVTIALAVGVQRMASRHVLVRHLSAVETLGCATVICTDKTGTLTTGRMSVREIWGQDELVVLDAAVACSNAELDESDHDGQGDPTEVAILVEAAARGVRRAAIETARPRVSEHPFDATRKRMSVGRADGKLYVKGAPELLFPLVTTGDIEAARKANGEMAARGMRVLGVALGDGSEERDLTLIGLVGLADPPRPGAIAAIAAARRAGVRTVMITGDQVLTAQAIARELGLLQPGDDPDEIVHARATPEDKLRIVREWKERGEIVAMTGDGVNDAPALREAHVGIAMGESGTDVAREASSVVLTNDDFASIVAGIREGRGIFENIQKTLVYLLAGNLGELLLVLGASVAGLPLPLTALQILWVNLVTDGLPALALVMDPTAEDVLDRAPRAPSAPILGANQWRSIGSIAVVEAVVVLATYVWALHARNLAEARNFAFSVLVFSEVLRSFAARSDTRVFFETGVLSNLKLLAVVAVTVGIQLAIHHLPLTERLFAIGELSFGDCVLSLALGLVPVTVVEVSKLAGRWTHPTPVLAAT